MVKTERAKRLHTNGDDICVQYYTWKMGKVWSGRHALRLCKALSCGKASIIVLAQREHWGRLDACPLRKRLADSPACERDCGDETVLRVLLRYDRYAEARKELREVAGDRWRDASYLLGGWSGCKNARTCNLVDGPRESWKPDLKV